MVFTRTLVALSLIVATALPLTVGRAETTSHPRLRAVPAPSKRPLAGNAEHFVDAAKGSDDANGTEEQPWKTIGRAVQQLHGGGTLYLRGGTYYEQTYLALAGRKDFPITIRSYPGEQAILDGSWSEFFLSPETSWQPGDSGPDVYVSTKSYPNVRDVVGSFGDSLIGLQTYYQVSGSTAAQARLSAGWPIRICRSRSTTTRGRLIRAKFR